MQSLSEKIAIITGGASGIGEATANTLASYGTSVVIADINEEGAQKVAAEITKTGGKAIACRTDIMEEKDIKRSIEVAVTEFGGLDFLHNNAGVPRTFAPDSEVSELPLDWWGRTIHAHLTSAMLGCKYAIPAMRNRGGGSIVNTSSIAGVVATVDMSTYGVAKAGVNQLTREVAGSYGRDNIRCNAVAPGPVLTLRAKKTLTRDMFRSYSEDTPLPRLSSPYDIANLVAFLFSDLSRMVTGQIINVDGGLMAKGSGWDTKMQELRGDEFNASAFTYEQAFGES
jgi:NAD(P)-dependent dehydrogenase (short-subunit alcohol dehydrogenase family)